MPTNPPTLDLSRIRAISLDLDDTLWPIAPVIERAEAALRAWLSQHAPMTAALFLNAHAVHDIREHVQRMRPEIRHNLSAVRREAIRVGLYRAGDNPLLADDAFEVFFAERNRVQFYPDTMQALQRLGQRYPLVALSNGNAQLERVGLAERFQAQLSASMLGFGKPDKRAFHAAAKAVGVEASALLHVGDDISLDALGALGAGLPAAWLNRHDELWPDEHHQPHLEVASLIELCDCLEV